MKQFLSILTVVCFTAAPVAAQEDQRLIPQWHQCLFEGKRWACYDMEEARALLVFEQKANYWKNLLDITQKRLQISLDQSTNLEQQLKLCYDKEDVYKSQVIDLTDQLNKEIALKNQFKVDADNITIWPLVVGGIVAILGVGFGVGVIIAK